MRSYDYYFTGKEQDRLSTAERTVSLVDKAAPAIAKIVAKLKGVIKKDDEVITLRDNFLKAFKQYGVTEGQWSPYISKHKVAHSDIPNVKVLGNYDSETKRVMDFSLDVMTAFFNAKAESYVAWLSVETDPIKAVNNALTGKLVPGSTPTTAHPNIAPSATTPTTVSNVNRTTAAADKTLTASLEHLGTPQKALVFGGIALLIIAVVFTMLK